MRVTGDWALDQWGRYYLCSGYPSTSVEYNIMLYEGTKVDRGAPSDGIPQSITRWRQWMGVVDEVVNKGLPNDHKMVVLEVYIGGRTSQALADEQHVSKRTIERKLELARFAVEVALNSVAEMACAT